MSGKDGYRPLGDKPGLYIREDRVLVDCAEFVRALGYPATPENQRACARAAAELFAWSGVPVVRVEEGNS